jgi:hypothetical protein
MKRLALVDGALHLSLPDEAPWILAEARHPGQIGTNSVPRRCLNAESSANH